MDVLARIIGYDPGGYATPSQYEVGAYDGGLNLAVIARVEYPYFANYERVYLDGAYSHTGGVFASAEL